MSSLIKYIIPLFILSVGCADTFRMTYTLFIPNPPYRLDKRLREIKLLPKQPHHYAVLIAGNSEDRHRNNLSMSYQVLLEQGYNREDVFIFDSEGGDTPLFPITDQTTERTIQMLFLWLSDHVTENDSLFIYMTGHGTKTTSIRQSAYVLNNGQILEKQTFIEMLETINPKVGIVFADFCYWGSITGHKRLNEYIFITATDDDHVSYGTTFARAFWKSFRKVEKQMSILDSYIDAYANDPFTSKRKDANHPSLSFDKNRPENYTLLGENVVR